MKTWSSRIRDLRKKGMTLLEIGASVGLSPSSVCDLQKGRSAEPRGEAALKLDSLHATKCAPQSGTKASLGR